MHFKGNYQDKCPPIKIHRYHSAQGDHREQFLSDTLYAEASISSWEPKLLSRQIHTIMYKLKECCMPISFGYTRPLFIILKKLPRSVWNPSAFQSYIKRSPLPASRFSLGRKPSEQSWSNKNFRSAFRYIVCFERKLNYSNFSNRLPFRLWATELRWTFVLGLDFEFR